MNPFHRTTKPAAFALGRLKAGTLNRTEQCYAAHLESQRQAGAVLWFAFEPLRLRIADGCHYCPDFLVMMADSTLEIHEVKGRWMDDSRVKIKAAAEIFPFKFKAIQKGKGGAWLEEHF